jgi:hypothetical protein
VASAGSPFPSSSRGNAVGNIVALGVLCLHAAIDEGVVFRLGRSDDTLVSPAEFFEGGSPRVADTSLAACFDWMHRRIEFTPCVNDVIAPRTANAKS